MRVWQGPVLEKTPPLGTPWACVHCCGEFRGPVAAELGQRRCLVHPGQASAACTYTCCGRSVVEPGPRGCRRCDHVPEVVWRQGVGPARDLFVPAFILPDTATPAPRDQLTSVPYRAALERRARLEPRWWATLPAEVTKPCEARAREASERHAAAAASLTRDYAFTPFVTSPEERARKQQARAGAGTGDAAPVVEFLVRSAGDPLAWQAAPTDLFSVAMARELRHCAVDWVSIPLLSS